MDLGIRGKAAVVCASTAGLGLATARALAAEGASVVITGRRSELAARIASELPGAHALGVDLTMPSAAAEIVTAAIARLGQIDILVLNGPGPSPAPALELDATAAEAAVRLLVATQVELVHRVLPGMRERGWGRIVAIGSSGIVAPLPNLAASNMGRAALTAYLKTLAGEVAADGVTVNIVVPGRIATDRVKSLDAAAAGRGGRSIEQVRQASESSIPARRYGRPEEFGTVAAFLSSALASYVTGTIVRCDGGYLPTIL
jgi:3-oxoacyl-[acyl-carrier protein] reductase